MEKMIQIPESEYNKLKELLRDNEELLNKAADEHIALKSINQHQRARLEMFDNCMSLFKAGQNNNFAGTANGQDLVYQLRKQAERVGLVNLSVTTCVDKNNV